MKDAFDYIIVGAGSAGCVLANRLSKNPSDSVLLIEAGGKDKHPLIHVPGGYIKNFRTRNDWQLRTTPQPHVLNREIYLPRGKTLGGSSSINAMAYVRGNAADFDHWAELGNKGWDYASVLPYFLKSEHHEQAGELDPTYHGTSGELNVTREVRYPTPYSKAFIEAGHAMGMPLNSDYNGAQQQGIGRFHFNIKDSKRNSAVGAFLKPAMQRSNLTVMTRTALTKIMLDKQAVTGVEVRRGGSKQVFKAHKEVLLCAGAFHTPQLMMLSGIGDPDDLQAKGVQVQHALSGVGKNLQDHLFYPVSALTKTHEGLNHAASLFGQAKHILQYYLRKQGPFTIGPLEAVAFFNLDDYSKAPNFQFHFTPMHPGQHYDNDFYNIRTFVSKYDGFTILPSLLHPKSRGTVSLAGPDPQQAPVIDPQFLSEPEDLEALIRGGKLAAELMRQPAMKTHVRAYSLPATEPENDADWAQHIKQCVQTIYHPVGTCKMGQDEMAVVDDQLKVRGLEKLRVVDASIMPVIVTGNTNAAVYMIAEKGADMILKGQ